MVNSIKRLTVIYKQCTYRVAIVKCSTPMVQHTDYNKTGCDAMGMCCEKKSDWVKKCMKYEVEGTRPRGRPKKTWREIVEKDCSVCGLNMEDAMVHSRCGKQIGMIDDHDACE